MEVQVRQRVKCLPKSVCQTQRFSFTMRQRVPYEHEIMDHFSKRRQPGLMHMADAWRGCNAAGP
eukprot:5910404-Amphidinium_carterae.1